MSLYTMYTVAGGLIATALVVRSSVRYRRTKHSYAASADAFGGVIVSAIIAAAITSLAMFAVAGTDLTRHKDRLASELGWNTQHSTVVNTDQVMTPVANSVVTRERHRVFIRPNDIFLGGDPITYHCDPRPKADTVALCMEAKVRSGNYYSDWSPARAFLAVALMVALMSLGPITFGLKRRLFGPPKPPAANKTTEETSA